MQVRANKCGLAFLFFWGAYAYSRVFLMADENMETEQDRHAKYRKLRMGGKSDTEAREEVWPSTRVGMKKNADEKARVEAEKTEE